MKLNRTYAGPEDMPATIPLFPLEGALLLPRRPMQLTVFEPRYLAMLDDALSGERLIGIIQPSTAEEAARSPELYPLGCAGRIVQYAEIGDGRCFLTLMGVARFRLVSEPQSVTPYRIAVADYAPFAEDFNEGAGEAAVDRDGLLGDAQTVRRGQRGQDRLERHQEGVERGAGQRPFDAEPLRAAGKSRRCSRPPTSGRAPRCWSRSRPSALRAATTPRPNSTSRLRHCL